MAGGEPVKWGAKIVSVSASWKNYMLAQGWPRKYVSFYVSCRVDWVARVAFKALRFFLVNWIAISDTFLAHKVMEIIYFKIGPLNRGKMYVRSLAITYILHTSPRITHFTGFNILIAILGLMIQQMKFLLCISMYLISYIVKDILRRFHYANYKWHF